MRSERSQTAPVGAALVVGGGIGGMQAALDLANGGIKVYLADRSPAIGGVMAQLDKTFPTNDCAMCTMAPRLVEIGRHKDIDAFHLAQSENVDILAAADLDQARGHGAHGAIVGRKSFVELGHHPADGRAFLSEINLDASVGQIKSGLHAADTASHDQGSTHRRSLGFFRAHGESPPPPAPAARLSP